MVELDKEGMRILDELRLDRVKINRILNVGVVSVLDACKIARVSKRTIYLWMKSDIIEFVYTPSGSRRILVDSLFWVRKTKPVPKTKRAQNEN